MFYSCCTSSSCEYWPQCGNSNPVKCVIADDSIAIIPNNGNKINIVNESDSSGKNSKNIKVSVTTTSLNNYGYYNPSSKPKATTVMVNSYKPSSNTMLSLANSKRLSNSSIIFLGDCEMPITKSANKGSDSGVSVSRTGINCEKMDNNMQKQQINNIKSSNGDLKQYFSTNQQTR